MNEKGNFFFSHCNVVNNDCFWFSFNSWLGNRRWQISSFYGSWRSSEKIMIDSYMQMAKLFFRSYATIEIESEKKTRRRYFLLRLLHAWSLTILHFLSLFKNRRNKFFHHHVKKAFFWFWPANERQITFLFFSYEDAPTHWLFNQRVALKID